MYTSKDSLPLVLVVWHKKHFRESFGGIETYIEVSLKSLIHFEIRLTKLRKGKAYRKHSVHEKAAASDILKLFISGNERCHTTDAP